MLVKLGDTFTAHLLILLLSLLFGCSNHVGESRNGGQPSRDQGTELALAASDAQQDNARIDARLADQGIRQDLVSTHDNQTSLNNDAGNLDAAPCACGATQVCIRRLVG